MSVGREYGAHHTLSYLSPQLLSATIKLIVITIHSLPLLFPDRRTGHWVSSQLNNGTTLLNVAVLCTTLRQSGIDHASVSRTLEDTQSFIDRTTMD